MAENVIEKRGKSAPPAFLLFEGGPASRLLTPLSAAQVTPRSIARSAALIVFITWVPMALLAALQGLAFVPGGRGSFLLDTAMYTRFWVALPVLLLSGAACGPRLRAIVEHFLDAGLVKESEVDRFRANASYAMESARSHVAEIVLLVLAYGHAAYLIVIALPWMPHSWRTVGAAADLQLSWAGWWLAALSQPLYSFAVLRLAYRVLVLWRFFWRTSRLDLDLIAAHADGAGGLGFLGLLLPRLGVPAFGVAAGLAGGLADAVWWTDMRVADYRYTLVFFVVGIVVLFAGPLLFFYLPLKQAKFLGKLSYGVLEERQLRQFERKWIASRASDATILSAEDFEAVADLRSTVAAVQKMRLVPFQRKDILALVLSAVAPFVPVLALEMPLIEIFKQLLKLAV